MCCIDNNVGIDMPMVIQKAPDRCTKKLEVTQEQGEGEDSPDEFEHLAVLPKTMRKTVHDGHKKVRHNSPSKRASKAKMIDRPSKFDHESSFMEASSVASRRQVNDQGRHQGRGDPNASGLEDALLDAVQRGSIEDCLAAIRRFPSSVNQKDKHHQTPIFWASAFETSDIAAVLIEAKAVVNSANKFGYTPLMRAVRHGRVAVAELLLQHGADLTAMDKFKSSIMQIAAGSGQSEALDWLLQMRTARSQLELRDIDGCTPLLVAVKAGHVAICSALLEAKAKPNVGDDGGRTPLLYALARNEVDVATTLVTCEADVNAQDEDGRPVIACLIENTWKHPDSRAATLCGVATALEARANPDATDDNGTPAIVLAAKVQDPTTCALLCAYGADLSASDENDRSAMALARKKGLTDIIRVLQDFGSLTVKKRDGFGKALLRATYYGNVEACKKLINSSADAGTTTSKDGKPLEDIAKRLGHSNVLKTLRAVAEQEGRSAEVVSVQHQASGAAGMQNKDALRHWLNELTNAGRLAVGVQAAARAGKPDGVVEVLRELCAPFKGPSEDEGTTAKLLSAFLKDRKAMTASQARGELRRLRLKARKENLDDLINKLRAWNSANGQPDQQLLYKLCNNGVAAVNAITITPLESEDPATRRLDEIQWRGLNACLPRMVSLFHLFAEERAAAATFPEEMMNCNDLQCPKCLKTYTTKDALADHLKGCTSKAGFEKKQEMEELFRKKAEFALDRLSHAQSSYETHRSQCQSSRHDINEVGREAKKSATQVVPLLLQCRVLLEVTAQVCTNREKACEDFAAEKTTSYNLRSMVADGGPANMCALCLLDVASKLTAHQDGSAPCLCLCASCGFDLMTYMKAKREVDCPYCQKPVSEIVNPK